MVDGPSINMDSTDGHVSSAPDTSAISFIYLAASNPQYWSDERIKSFINTFGSKVHEIARHNTADLVSVLRSLNIEGALATREWLASAVLQKLDFYRVHKLTRRSGEKQSESVAEDIVKLLRIHVEDKAPEPEVFYSVFSKPVSSKPTKKTELDNTSDAIKQIMEICKNLQADIAQYARDNNELKAQVRALLVHNKNISVPKASQGFTMSDTPSSTFPPLSSTRANHTPSAGQAIANHSNSYASATKRVRLSTASPTSPQTSQNKSSSSKVPFQQGQLRLRSFDSYNPSAPNQKIDCNEGFKVVGPRRKTRHNDYISRVGTGSKTYTSIASRKQTVFFGRFNPGTTLEEGTAILDEIVTRDNIKPKFENIRLLTLPSKKIAFLFEIDYSLRNIVEHHDIWPKGTVVDYSTDPAVVAKRKSFTASSESKASSSPKNNTHQENSTVRQFNTAN